MKIKSINILLFATALLLSACTDYLTPPQETRKSESDVFGNYSSFQAYTDQLYTSVTDPMDMQASDACFGGEAIGTLTSVTGGRAIIGDYAAWMARGYFGDGSRNVARGIWGYSWPAIRKANIGLNNINYLMSSSATDEQKALIKGQLYFLRAFFHFEILAAWGSIPYINKVIVEDLNWPRYYEYKGKRNYQACTEYIVQDLDSAIKYLPAYWPNDLTDRGHATKFSAMGYKARALLYAGSPLMNEASGNTAVADPEYMKRAADAAWELINLSRNTYLADGATKACDLLPWNQYSQMFATTDGTHPWKSEIIWSKYRYNKGATNFTGGVGRIHVPEPAIFGGVQLQTVTQNYTDIFEMADGTLYDPAKYDSDNDKRWDFRDPRFRSSIYVDRDNAGLDPTATVLTLYSSGGVSGSGNTKKTSLTPYVIHKFWPKGVNAYDASRTGSALYNNFQFQCPLMRLAEIYLIYAEGVNEGYGSPLAKAPGADITAVDAVNIIRQRAYQGATYKGSPISCPLATADATAYVQLAAAGGPGAFTRLVLNENAVETTFEGRYWYDLRRWKLAEKLNQTPVYDMLFDKNWTPTSFTRTKIATRVFETKHYWMPFPLALTQMYADFPQNEGW